MNNKNATTRISGPSFHSLTHSLTWLQTVEIPRRQHQVTPSPPILSQLDPVRRVLNAQEPQVLKDVVDPSEPWSSHRSPSVWSFFHQLSTDVVLIQGRAHGEVGRGGLFPMLDIRWQIQCDSSANLSGLLAFFFCFVEKIRQISVLPSNLLFSSAISSFDVNFVYSVGKFMTKSRLLSLNWRPNGLNLRFIT